MKLAILSIMTYLTGSDVVQDLIRSSVLLLDDGRKNLDIVDYDNDSRDSF